MYFSVMDTVQKQCVTSVLVNELKFWRFREKQLRAVGYVEQQNENKESQDQILLKVFVKQSL